MLATERVIRYAADTAIPLYVMLAAADFWRMHARTLRLVRDPTAPAAVGRTLAAAVHQRATFAITPRPLAIPLHRLACSDTRKRRARVRGHARPAVACCRKRAGAQAVLPGAKLCDRDDDVHGNRRPPRAAWASEVHAGCGAGVTEGT